jgi:isopentenyl diphosphate isomerase/L-lactate dehydrogenase-like FMN-dependent dehydrogenase
MDLNEVRKNARERLKGTGTCAVYKVCDGHPDRLCQGLKYGDVPGMGGAGSGMSFHNNFLALQRIQLRMRDVGSPIDPDPSFELFGTRLEMPIIGASTSGMRTSLRGVITDDELSEATVHGCKAAGTISARGDGADTIEHNPGIAAIREAGGWGIQVFKPVEQGLLLERIRMAEDAGVMAVGVDLDGCGSLNLARIGYPVFRKTSEELKEIVRATGLPVLFKGVMELSDAEAVVESGAAAIAVSNHGGRVLDHTPGVADVLPGIAQLVDGRMLVFADGAVRSGYDAIKLLALGADVVMVGRPLIRAVVGGGPEGVRLQMEFMKATLKAAMKMTGCADLAAIGPHIIA